MGEIMRLGSTFRMARTGVFIGARIQHKGQDLTIRIADVVRFGGKPPKFFLDNIIAARAGNSEAIERLTKLFEISGKLRRLGIEDCCKSSSEITVHIDVFVSQQVTSWKDLSKIARIISNRGMSPERSFTLPVSDARVEITSENIYDGGGSVSGNKFTLTINDHIAWVSRDFMPY